MIGVQHLQEIGISIKELLPPPELQFSNADGSPMKGKLLGSMEAVMKFGEASYKGYIDVLSSLPTPLLCYDALLLLIDFVSAGVCGHFTFKKTFFSSVCM